MAKLWPFRRPSFSDLLAAPIVVGALEMGTTLRLKLK
jgi:hypothetical protein